MLEQAYPIPDPDGVTRFVQGFLFDTTDRNTEELAFLAYHDKLTGLPNRQLFDEMLTLAMARARRHGMGLALLLFDLDSFKQVNDALGHQVGDRLLSALAERLRPCVREADIFGEAATSSSSCSPISRAAARGPRTGPRHRRGRGGTDRLRARGAVRAGSGDVHGLGSIGISLFPHDAGDAPTMLKHADVAMNESKRTRPGGWTVYPGPAADGVSAASSERALLAKRVPQAVEARAWELRWLPVSISRTGGSPASRH